MSIQKITGLSLPKKNLNNNATNDKNSFVSGISFKGYSKVITARNGSQPQHYPDPHGTSGGYDSPGRLSTIDSYNIRHPEKTIVISGNKGYESQSIEQAAAKVYFADAGEAITQKIKDEHMYIVKYDQPPKIVAKEAILKEEKASKLKEFIDTLEERTPYLKGSLEEATEEEKKAKTDVSVAEKKLQAAQKTLDEKEKIKQEKEKDLNENQERLDLAKSRLDEVKKKEAERFKAIQTRQKLEAMQKQLNELNDGSDSGLAAIAEQLKYYLSGNKG
ncbi:hypothetical protein IJ182_05845 [bacterium]|nr:hypothetical protein [bacterium]